MKHFPRRLVVLLSILILSLLLHQNDPAYLLRLGTVQRSDEKMPENNVTVSSPIRQENFQRPVSNDNAAGTKPNRYRKWNASDLVGLEVLKLRDRPYFERGWDSSPVIVPSHKLMFWTTPKIACTLYKQLFRRMAGHSDWATYWPHNPWRNGLTYLYDYPPEEADRMLTDPSWTRAVFVREPKKRFLSAYLDKAVSGSGKYVRGICCRRRKSLKTILGCDQPRGKNRIATFEEFAYHVAPQCRDPHWESQKHHIPDHYWNVINFVGHFETAQTDSERLLRKINAWEEYGTTGWPTTGGGMFDANIANHATNATTKMQKFYNNSAVERYVEKLYQMDYDFPLFNFSKTTIAPSR